MPISVRFRGPMLFVTDTPAAEEINDVVDQVIIPDAAGADAVAVAGAGGAEPAPSTHADGSPAIVHTAGLLLRTAGRPDMYVPLRGRSVSISADGETAIPKVDAKYLAVAPIHEMTNPDGTPPDNLVRRLGVQPGKPTTIVMRGGAMSGELMTDRGIEMPVHLKGATQRPICSMPVWSSSAASGSIEIAENGTDPTVIPLDANTEVFIYNWDVAFPRKEELTTPLDSLGTFQDNDFKWIYQLLTPPRGSWQAWLGADPFLPAPRSLKFLTAPPAAVPIEGEPPISTCDGSRSRGMQIA